MDISGNFGHVIFQYNKNIRDYNDNMRLYLDIIANRERVHAQNNYRNNNQNDYTYYYTQPVRPLNNIFSSLFPTVRRENTLQDVIVRPTREQILNATEMVSFNDRLSNNNTTCPITLEPFTNGQLVCRIKHCSHLFKQDALNDWFRRNVRCPICRYDIREYRNDDFESEVAAEETSNDNDDDNEYSEMVEELLNETMQRDSQPQNQQNPSSRNTFTSNLATAIRGFINNELTNLPPSLNNVASELLYTFDIPLTFDMSGNFRV